MSLISQPGSDYQLAQFTLDAGNARDIMLLLIDLHAVAAVACYLAPGLTKERPMIEFTLGTDNRQRR